MPVRKPSHWITAAALAGALTLTATSAVAAPTRDTSNNNTTHKITQAVSQQKLTEHLNAFQSIAEANDGNRASGTSGYQASVDYVVERLRLPSLATAIDWKAFRCYVSFCWDTAWVILWVVLLLLVSRVGSPRSRRCPWFPTRPAPGSLTSSAG